MHSRQLTFIQVMEDTRYQALNSYLIKALKSNHLAKVTQGVDRRRAYEIKHHYLSEAISMALWLIRFFLKADSSASKVQPASVSTPL
jgi:hypothetical protein